MRFSRLNDWLEYQENLSNKSIDLGLERVERVLNRMDLDYSWTTVVTVAGTNGKGSCVAMLSSILVSAGFQVGSYTSPHLLKYNERICINNIAANDEVLCDAFSRVEQARGDTLLTYFEFGTLAALAVFARSALDVVILEVGLGGRLDAVNVLAPDIALITNIGMDHQQWLGFDRNAIGREKAGILRHNTPVVCGDYEPPSSLMDKIQKLDCPQYCVGKEFFYKKNGDNWRWQGSYRTFDYLPLPALDGDHQLTNAACTLMVLELLYSRHAVTVEAVRDGLIRTVLPGRFQTIPGPIRQILDVAHNADSAKQLAHTLQQMDCPGEIHAVVAMLKDKDIAQVLQVMKPVVDRWYLAGLDAERGANAEQLKIYFSDSPTVKDYHSVTQAHAAAVANASPGDCVVVFGSFYTVAKILSPEI